MGRGADAGRPVDVDADIALARDRRRAGVDADAHADRAVDPLDLLGRGERVVRATEGDEERVALGVDLDPGMAREDRAQLAPVLGEQVHVALAVLMEQARRTLDVGEQEGDRAGGEVAHRANDGGVSARFGLRPDNLPRPTMSPTTSVVPRKALNT